jgi:hopene-associated glycosyltransferase HpnB
MILDLAAACTVAIWLYLIFGRGLFWKLNKPRESEGPRPVQSSKRVAIVIPARNEAECVGASIASLLSQDYSEPYHIFLVDDHSHDGTADAALSAAREADKPDLLTAIRARSLPEGWTGKLWALAEGVDRAQAFQPDYVLFSDADIMHAPDSLARLAARADAGGCDLVSCMVKLRCETFAERALIPAFVFFFFMLYPPAWTASSKHATAGAAGGCILIRWQALARIGGIAAIRGELIDDCALAKAVKSTGGKIWLGLTSKTRSIRGYGTFGEIGRMISRTAFWQLRHSSWLLVGTMAGLFITYVLPPLLLLTGRLVPASLGMAAWVLMMVAYAPSLRFYGMTMLWAPALPAIALFYSGATLHSALRYWSGQGGEWKGRVQDRKRDR